MIKKFLCKSLIGKAPIRKRLLNCILPCLAFTFTLLFFGPMSMAYNSRNYINCGLTTVIKPIAGLFLLCFVLLTVFMSLLYGDIHTPFISILTGITLACFIQGTYLNPDLGVLDGSEIVWNQYSKKSIINLFIWLLILSIPFIIRYISKEFWKHFCNIVSCFVILILGISLGISIIPEIVNENSSENNQTYGLTNKDKFVFGSKENVVFICLDMADNSLMNSVLKQYPDVLDPLHDFTYFDNFNTHYYGTFPSVTYFLTHTDYDAEKETVNEYFSRAWNSKDAQSFYDGLEKAGYRTNMYISQWVMGDLANMVGKIDNVIPIDPSSYHYNKKALLNLYYVSLYYHLPIICKAPFNYYTDDIVEIVNLDEDLSKWDSAEAIRYFWENGASAGDYEKSFVYYHFDGAHGPLSIDKYGKPGKGITFPREDALAGHFRVISELFQYMKDLEIYNTSTIIITADHGRIFTQQPILFIKRPGEKRAEMKVSHAPVDQADLFATIAEQAGLADPAQYGETVYQIPEDTLRERCCQTYYHDDSFPNADQRYNTMFEICYTGDGSVLKESNESNSSYRVIEAKDGLY